MAKITLNDITSGYNVNRINSNFQALEDIINNKLLSRNPEGEPNSLQDLIDMNSNRIINLPEPENDSEPVTLGSVQQFVDRATGANIVSETIPTQGLRQGLRWYKPSDAVTYVYYIDTDGAQWIEEPVQSAEGTLREELAAVGSTVLISGIPANRLVNRPESYGAVGDGLVDDTAAISACLNAGGFINATGGTYLVTSNIIAASKFYLFGGTIIVDRVSLGAGVSAISSTANESCLDGVTFSPLVNPGMGNVAEDTEAYCVDFNADSCCVKNCTVTQGLPNGFRSKKSNAPFYALNNRGQGTIDGLSADTRDITLINVFDGQRGLIKDNVGINYGHVLLFGLSSNEFIIEGNIGVDCGNHLIYVSSGNRNIIKGNAAYGPYTDIKARGDHNTLTNNLVLGGTLTLTNAVADTGNGKCINHGVVANNTVRCDRTFAIPLAVSFRTGFDGNAANVVVTGNTVDSTQINTLGIYVQFADMESFTVSNNTVMDSALVGDAILFTPTSGILTTANRRATVVGNSVSGASQSAIQFAGEYSTISSNSVECQGGSGTNSGAILAFTDKCSITGNTARATNSGISALNQRGGDNNVISSNILQNLLSSSQLLETGVANVKTGNALL